MINGRIMVQVTDLVKNKSIPVLTTCRIFILQSFSNANDAGISVG